MADEKIELTPEQQEQIATLLEPLAQKGAALFPMEQQFKGDLQELDRILAAEEEGESGAEPAGDSALPLDSGLSSSDLDAADELSGEPSPSTFDFGMPSEDESSLDFDQTEGFPTGLEPEGFAAEPASAEPSDFDFTEPPAATEETPETEAFDAGTFDPGSEFGETNFDLDTPASESAGETPGFDSAAFEPEAETAPADFATDLGADSDTDSGSDFGADFGTLGEELTPSVAAEPELGEDFAPASEMDFGSESPGFSTPTSDTDFGADFGSADLPMDAGEDLGGDLGALDSRDIGTDLGGGELAASDFGSDLASDSSGFGPDADDGLGLDSMPSAEAEPAGFTPGAEGAMESGELDLGGDLGDLSGLSTESEGDGLLGDGELDEMTRKAHLAQGIGDEFTDEDLAKIRSRLEDVTPGLKKAIVDATVEEKISRPDQQLLMHMLIDNATEDAIADFLEPRIGYRPDLAPPQFRKDGVQIIYADGMSPEELAGRRKRVRLTFVAIGAGLLGMMGVFGGLLLYQRFSIAGTYNEGLKELALASRSSGSEKEEHKKRAELLYKKALESAGTYDAQAMNRYGLAYMRAGYYEEAFEKLFGKVNPAYDWSEPGVRAPLIRLKDGARFPSPAQFEKGDRAQFLDRSNAVRTLDSPGAYTLTRLRDGKLDKTTLLSLGKFHSHSSQSFKESPYRNEELGIDYYRLILTLLELPDDVDARSGIGDVYYNRAEFGAASREYNRILEKFPNEIKGHAGLLNTYIELWKQNGDPRYVIARHRSIQSLGIEDDLPIYILTKLAGFYIDLDEEDVRIRYQVDPVNSINNLGLQDNATHLLEVVFNKKEERDGETISGANYGEGFYQRGRFLLRQKEGIRALRQFQNAHQHDGRHFLAVREMGAYYRENLDFTKAEEYFRKAIELRNQFQGEYGARPEDETLIGGDKGLLFYDLGSLLFLKYAGLTKENPEGFADSRIYPDRGQTETTETQKRRELLSQARDYFEQALKEDLKEKKAKIESTYWIGWIDYISADFEGALTSWEGLQDIFPGNYSDPVLLMGRANAAYYADQTRSAMGDYLKVQDDLEAKMANLEANGRAVPTSREHQKLFLTLAALYNNLGATYEREHMEARKRGASRRSLEDLEKNSLKYYWKAIESARKIDEDNDIARTNLQMAFKPGIRKSEPILDDWISPVLPSLNEKRAK